MRMNVYTPRISKGSFSLFKVRGAKTRLCTIFGDLFIL